MPRALMISKNLIGDGIYVQPALAAWVQEHPEWEVELLTLDDHTTCLYRGMGLALKVVFEKMGQYDFEFNFDVNRAFSLGEKEKLHIAQGYAKMLGVQIQSKKPRYTPPEGETEKGLILLSMFSRSCASREGKPPNKMLPWVHWAHIVALLRQYGKIAVLGGPEDRAHDKLEISEEEYYTGLPLELVARLLRDAKLLVTIDNGMAHLAATQETPTVEFYPACLGVEWIVPPNAKALVAQMDPTTLTVIDAVFAVREGLRRYWRE